MGDLAIALVLSTMKTLRRFRGGIGILLILLLTLEAPPAGAGRRNGEGPPPDDAPSRAQLLAPASWLALGPLPVALPAFHESAAAPFGAEDLLDQPWVDLDGLWPAAGDAFAWVGGDRLTWRELPSPLRLGSGEGSPAIALLATYLEAERFVQAKLEVRTAAWAEVFVDGESVGARKDASAEESVSAELALTPGKHLVLVGVVLPVPAEEQPGGPGAATLAASISLAPVGEGVPGAGDLRFTTDPAHGLRLEDVLDVPAVAGVDLAPDGRHLAVHLRRPSAQPAEGSEAWTEIFRVPGGDPVRSLQGGESGFAWAPDGSRYSYRRTRGEGGPSDLWVASLEEGGARRLLEAVEGLGTARWLPDGRSLIYQVQEKEEADSRGVKRYRGLNDRWAGFRDHGHLVQVSVESGARRRLTAGPDDVTFLDVSPAGDRLLLSVNRYQPTVWPYTSDDLFELDLETLASRELASVPWFRGAVYDRSREGVLVLAGPSSFGSEGLSAAELGDGASPANEYDTQLYHLGPEGGAAESLTRSFDPAVEEVAWSGETLLVRAQIEDRLGIFLRGPGSGSLTPSESGLEKVEGLDGDESGAYLAYYGSSVDRSPTVFVQVLEGGEPRAVYRASPDLEERLRLGAVREWSFSADGGEIQGRLHLPPDFDAGERYPLIVYYYGGTVPTERNFADRYPFHVWTDQGYVVYVLQPSGATGYGQGFSSRHVNNWGRTVADEILRGTEEVLAAHAFLDRRRVGCIGASYGGFMTMLLLTRTDLFAGAVAHAGISSISSYWGEGNWGYLYSAQASSRSFPWSHRELYVDQSPLFSADRISTPLLLLHGTADTNVPIGESQQMYTALEMLGKEVELVTFDGEDHRIASRDKRRVWSETILAWFAWKLKGQPEWWQHLYGSAEKPKG